MTTATVLAASVGSLVPISGLSPYPDGGNPNAPLAVTACNGAPQTGTELGIPVRDAGELPDIAVNCETGELYIVWQDTRFNPDGLVGVVISRSTDGGSTWSDPVPVNQLNPDLEPAATQAFLPAVAVADDGTVGVLFYDFRNNVLGDDLLSTDVHLALFEPDLTLRRGVTPWHDDEVVETTGDNGNHSACGGGNGCLH